MVKSNLEGLKLILLPLALGIFHFFTLHSALPLYLLGQLAGAIFFFQSFILLHEFGHNSLFKTKWINIILGHITSIFVFIPFDNWRLIHHLHHKWTGWRDKDPTTEKTFDDRLSAGQRAIINFCWKFHVPIFTLGYRLGIYWKVEKLRRHLNKSDLGKCFINMLVLILVYVLVLKFFLTELVLLLPALYLSFILTDILSLSQHSNIYMPSAAGVKVDPLKYVDQAVYSRSLILPNWIAHFVFFNMNYHQAHHAYPGLPCYYLPQKSNYSENSYAFWGWLKKVKKIEGVEFVFKTSKDRSKF